MLMVEPCWEFAIIVIQQSKINNQNSSTQTTHVATAASAVQAKASRAPSGQPSRPLIHQYPPPVAPPCQRRSSLCRPPLFPKSADRPHRRLLRHKQPIERRSRP